MSLSTEDRIKAFLNRQKEKTSVPEPCNNTSAKIDLNFSRGFNISSSFLKERDDETINTLNSEMPTISLELEHKNSSSPPLKGGGDLSSDLNFDDLEIRMEFIKGFNNSQRIPQTQPRPRTYEPLNSPAKDKPKAESPIRLPTNQSEDMSITNKSAEIASHRDLSQNNDSSPSKTKSPLDKFFQQKSRIKQKITKSFRSRSKDSRSFSSIKSRNKTPTLNQEDQKEGIRSPRWNTTTGAKSLKAIEDTENEYHSFSPRFHTNPRTSPDQRKLKLKKTTSVERKMKHETSDSRLPEFWRENSEFSSSPGKVSSEMLSLEKLLQSEKAKNREGFFGQDNSLSRMDSIERNARSPTKTPERTSYSELSGSSPSSTRRLVKKQITPQKKRRDSIEEDDEDEYSSIKNTKIFDGAAIAIQKLENDYGSFPKPERGQGGNAGSNGHQEELEEKHAAFKREMKELLTMIQREKEQIFQNLGEMSRKLAKYKTSYKSLVNSFICSSI